MKDAHLKVTGTEKPRGGISEMSVLEPEPGAAGLGLISDISTIVHDSPLSRQLPVEHQVQQC